MNSFISLLVFFFTVSNSFSVLDFRTGIELAIEKEPELRYKANFGGSDNRS